MRLARPLLLTLLLASPAVAQEATRIPATPAQLDALVADDWYGVYMQGKKSGFARITFKKSGTKADPTYTSSMQMELRMVAMGQKQRMVMTNEEVFDGTPPYALRSATSSQVQGPRSQKVTATTTDKKTYSIVIDSAGTTRTLSRPALDYTYLDTVGAALWFQSPRAVGQSTTYQSLDLDEWRLSLQTLTVKTLEQKMLDGVKTKLYTVHMKSSTQGELGTGTADERGNILQMTMMGMLDIRREPAELAKKIEYSADLFVRSMIKVKQKLGKPQAIKRLELKVTGPARELIESGSFQTVTKGPDAVTIVIDVAKGTPVAATEAEIAENLKETADYPIGHTDVIALAKKAVGDATTPAQKVERLIHFVSEYVKDAYGKNAVSALEVIKLKVGDCTEHALLFATLARAAGIPTREVGGVMYMGDEVQAFGGHAWNEVVLDGKWIPVDPTWDEPRIDAAHVRTDKGENSQTLQILGRVKFEVVKVGR